MSSSAISNIRSAARVVRIVALDLYDKEQTSKLLPLIANVMTVTPEEAEQEKVLMEWLSAYPQLRQWIGPRVSQGAFKDALELVPKLYEITHSENLRSVGEGKVIATMQKMVPKDMLAVAQGKLQLALQLYRDNALTYDGQNLFDTGHLQPDGVTTASNLIAPTTARDSDAAPTVAELKLELRQAQQVLMANQTFRNQLIESNLALQNVVIAHSIAVYNAFYQLLTEESFGGGDKNIYKGTFVLLRDTAPASGEEDSWDLVLNEPGGPKPVIFAPFKEAQFEIDDTKEFATGAVDFGVWGKFAAQTAWWQSAVRVKPA